MFVRKTTNIIQRCVTKRMWSFPKKFGLWKKGWYEKKCFLLYSGNVNRHHSYI